MEDGGHARECGAASQAEFARQVHVGLGRQVSRKVHALADGHPAVAARVCEVHGEGPVEAARAVRVHHRLAGGAGRAVDHVRDIELQEAKDGLHLCAGHGGGEGQLELVAARGHSAGVQVGPDRAVTTEAKAEAEAELVVERDLDVRIDVQAEGRQGQVEVDGERCRKEIAGNDRVELDMRVVGRQLDLAGGRDIFVHVPATRVDGLDL